MNIGILSMQRIPNYGSLLQALSLKLFFESKGHEVFFIDIKTGRQIAAYPKRNIFKKFDRYFFRRISHRFFQNKMILIHSMDARVHLQVDKRLSKEKTYDLVIIGSDEVFNATQPCPWGFTTQLFGDVESANKIATYAASCGSTTFESAQNYHIVSEIKKAMNKLSDISVRDTNTFDFVKRISGIEPMIHVDPVFLANYDSYISNKVDREPYMLVYAYRNRISDKNEIAVIKSYARNHNLEIVCVGMPQSWCKINIKASAFELLEYIQKAQCIVTDTFHGAVFSIKYNKNFAVFVRESNEKKLGGLLNQFDLRSQIVKYPNELNNVLDAGIIDYSVVNEIILREQTRSKKYLDSLLN